MTRFSKIAALFAGATIMTQTAFARDVATDPHLDPTVRSFLVELNKDPSPFWELPQPKPQDILTGLQNPPATAPVPLTGRPWPSIRALPHMQTGQS
jgi:acetyl esterase